MAEFLDVIVGHAPDGPPWVLFEDDNHKPVAVQRISAEHDEHDNFVEIYRIQHDTVSKL